MSSDQEWKQRALVAEERIAQIMALLERDYWDAGDVVYDVQQIVDPDGDDDE